MSLCLMSYWNVWRRFSSRRTQAIIWKMLYQLLPTKNNLIARNVIISNGDNICAFCGSCEENLLNIFFDVSVCIANLERDISVD